MTMKQRLDEMDALIIRAFGEEIIINGKEEKWGVLDIAPEQFAQMDTAIRTLTIERDDLITNGDEVSFASSGLSFIVMSNTPNNSISELKLR